MRAWLLVSLAVAMAMMGDARAADWYTGVPDDGPPIAKAPRVAVDIAFDGTSQGALSGALIGTIAPFAPMTQSGLRVRIGGLASGYSYYSATPGLGKVNGVMVGGSFLIGYEWVIQRATIAAFAGGDINHTSISPNDPNNSVKGTRGGLKLGVDFYVTPTDSTMIAGVVTYSTNYNAYYGRLKFGFAIANHTYVGPEVLALGDNFFQQWRFGGHVSGLRLGMLQFGVSGGFLNDRVRGAGLYGSLDTRVMF